MALALRPGANQTPFQDEGLYLFMGHRMISHLVHGTFLPEYPGTYFSGAPALYPVLAALADHVDGLRGARLISLAFALGATVSVAGVGRELYGRRAGLLGAFAFVLCGSVIFQSDFATFDSTMMFLVAVAAWVTVRSVHRDAYRWFPAVAALLVLAFYVKYAAAAYLPIVAVLAIAAASPSDRVAVARRAGLMVASALGLGLLMFAIWGRSLSKGIRVTTLSRVVENPASASHLLHQTVLWVGPWIALALLGAVVARKEWQVPLVLLVGAVIAPLQQVRIGEDTSLDKHVAFGIVFAAPLIGLLFDRAITRSRVVGVPVAVVVFCGLGGLGLHYSHQFLTSWVNDGNLLPPLRQAVDAAPGRPILGEQPDSERWALEHDTRASQWHDTYYLSYGGMTGNAAYADAIAHSYFGVIYLVKQPYAGFTDGSPTPTGAFLYRLLQSGQTPYHEIGTVNRIQRGHIVGHWYIYAPK